VREGQATPAHLAADLNAGRRRATIAAQLIELGSRLTDAAVAMFCRLVGRQFARARSGRNKRHLDTRKAAARLLGLFRDTLRTLGEANDSGGDAIELLQERIGWHRLMQAQAELEGFEGADDPDPLITAAEKSDRIRHCGRALIEDVVFRSARRSDPLLLALDLLRQLYRDGGRALPARPPVSHIRDPIRKAVFAGNKPDRRLYEVATLAALRDRLRSGDVWVEGGRAFRPLSADLVPAATVAARKEAGTLRLGVPEDVVAWLAEKRDEVVLKLQQLANRARAGKLKGVRLVDGKLVVSPDRSTVPKAVEAAKGLILGRMPLVRITELIAEVDGWTRFSEDFTHLRTGDLPRNLQAMHAGILADAVNLGPTRMAEASAGVTARQIGWCRQWHAHDAAFKAGVARIIDTQLAHPYARIWGDGTTSSSDGQFFPAAGRARKRSDVNTHYSHGPGGKHYTWVSDQYGHFYILPIGVTESEAPYVLDGIYGHGGRLDIAEHYVDTGGASDHVFGLFAVLGRRLVPRLRDLKDWCLYTFAGQEADAILRQHVGGRIDEPAIREAWDEILRIGLSIEDRAVAPSVVLKKLAAMPKTNLLFKALREIGRIERTLFMIEWYSSPALRARCRTGLNKGEAGHKLIRAVFFHERGEIRDAAFESQAFRASALNLVVSAIILWNTVSVGLSQSAVSSYLTRARQAGLSWPLPEGLDDEALELLLFPRPPDVPPDRRPKPDLAWIHRELRRPNVTLALLWEEYRAGAADGMGYSWFCDLYREWSGRLKPTLRQVHPAGEKLFVDFAGQTLDVVDGLTGESRPVQIFVAVLGASSFTYAEAVWTQTLPDWIGAHVNAFRFFGGAARQVVSDNLKAGVIRASLYEPMVNRTYAGMAEHYGTAVMPARPYKPRDKAKVEVGVQVVQRWILARLRHRRFFLSSVLQFSVKVGFEISRIGLPCGSFRRG
jgi:TnpA family transposase/transposase/cell division inhibitor SulA